MSNEAKVGGVFVVLVVVATGVALYMGGCWARMGTYHLYVRFADAGTIEPGSDVMMAGVKIGTVADVSLRPDEQNWPGQPAVITLAIHKRYTIPANYRFSIGQGGLLGVRYVSVDPPRKEKVDKGPAGLLQPGQEVSGEGLKGMAALDEMADALKEDMPELGDTLRRRIEHLADRAEATYLGVEQEKLVRQILRNLSSMTRAANRAALQAERLAATLNATARAGRPEVVAMLRDLRAAAASVRETAAVAQRFVATSTLPVNLEATGLHLREATASAREAAEAVRDLLASPETRERFDTLTQNLARSSEHLTRLTEQAEKLVGDEAFQADVKASAASLRETMKSLEETTEHLRKVLTDPTFTEDLRATVHNLRQASVEGAEVARKASSSLDRVDRTMDRLSEAVSSIRPERTTGLLDIYGLRHSGLGMDVDLDFYYGAETKHFWRLGMVDLGDRERTNLQRGFVLGGPWTLRAGIFANKPGLGIDWYSPRGWRAELEFWNPDESYLDFSLHRRLGDDWLLSLGVHDLLHDREPFVGFRREFSVSGSPPDGAAKK
ncbi:MAG: MlaD family protein [Armatimonadetes bacterium]|nr:MlaD family protein [Armatimonadota bacterium]